MVDEKQPNSETVLSAGQEGGAHFGFDAPAQPMLSVAVAVEARSKDLRLPQKKAIEASTVWRVIESVKGL